MIAGPSPLDQFMARNPEYFFSQSPEYGLVNPDNPYILGEHVKRAAYELPFKEGDATLCGTRHREILGPP